MAWNDAVVVNGGLELLNQTGGKFYLDYAAGGSETVDAKTLMAQTALKAQKQTLPIVGVQDVDKGKKLNILITSQGLASGYDMRQIGIWAHVDDGPARLFAIIQDSRGVSIPSQTEMPDFAMNFYAVIKYSGDVEFHLSVDPDALVSQGDMRAAIAEAAEAKQDKLTGTAGQMVGFDEDGNPEAQDPPDTGVTSFNGRKGAVTPKSGDYTAEQVGARPSTWTPTAEDVGALPSDGTAAAAVKLSTARSIDGVEFDGSGDCFHFGTCSTSGSTAAKTVELTGFQLDAGARVAVKFTNANTASSPTLNVNSTGAKYIKKYGTTAPDTYMWQAGAVVEFVYDGTNWIMLNGTTATTTYYGLTKLSSSVTSTSTTEAATPSAVKQAYDLANTAQTAANEAKTLIEQMKQTSYKHYSVKVTTANTNPESAVVYLDDAVGMSTGYNAWKDTPIFKDIKPCVVKDGVVQYYLDPDDLTRKEDGTAATITDPNAGDVMIEIPKLGFKMTTNGTEHIISVTDDPSASGYCYRAHSLDDEGDCDKIYIGAYLGSKSGSALCSVSGVAPEANITLTAARTAAQARGTGYQLVSFYPLTFLQCLYLIMYKNRNGQEALGKGHTSGGNKISTGGTNAKGMCFGSTSSATLQMCFLGIEDFWGNMYWWIDGIFCDSVRNIKTAFKDFTDNGNGYPFSKSSGLSDNISNYMSDIQGTNEGGFTPKAVSGSSTTCWADSAYLHAGFCARFGGYWSDGSYAGPFRFLVAYSASSSYSSLSARLMYKHKAE